MTDSPVRHFAGLALLAAAAALAAAFASPSSARVEPQAWPGLRADQLFAIEDEAQEHDVGFAAAPASATHATVRLGNLAWTGADRAPAGYRLGDSSGDRSPVATTSHRGTLAAARID